jgi:aryl-alcohol dehydrogenase-like predicted oxidoreductase
MRQRRLGSTGLMVSELCLGAMTFGGEADEETSRSIIAAFLDAGGNFFDTADCYHAGRSEEILGSVIGRHRDEYVIATKSGLRVGDGPNDVGASAKHLSRSVERSMRRLGTDYIDLYQLHCWDPCTPLEETLGVLEVLWRQGKIRYLGISNYAGWQIARISGEAARRGLPAIASAQVQYSLVEREVEREVVPACLDLGLAVLPWGPLGGGFLSGKYRQGANPPADSRLARSQAWMEEHWERRAAEPGWRTLEAVRAITLDTGASCAQVALAWVAGRPAVASPIIGASTLGQALDNLGAAGLTLAEEHRTRLDEVSALLPAYPQRFISVAMSSRANYDPTTDSAVGMR